MKQIRRIAPPRKASTRWDVKFRPTPSGIVIDIAILQPQKLKHLYLAARSSYLIPWSQIDAWASENLKQRKKP